MSGVERQCLTPGTVYNTRVSNIEGAVRITVDVRPPATPQYQRDWFFNYPNAYSDELRDAIHDAIEPIVARMQRLPIMVDWQHPDNLAVDRFAERMKAKLAAAREKGRGGWDDQTQCNADYLRQLLHEHIGKGDPVDVANFCMMLDHYAALTTPAPEKPDALAERVKVLEAALKPFVAHWQSWMDDEFEHPDYDEMSCFARVTYGDVRTARAALQGNVA